MKYILFTTIGIIITFSIYGQVDNNGRPIVYKEVIEDTVWENYNLQISYYSIKDNLDNNNSSLSFYDNLILENYTDWSRRIFSYEFEVTMNGYFYLKVTLNQLSEKNIFSNTYSIVKNGIGLYKKVPCTINGEITEKRAIELIENKYDTNAYIIKNDSVFKLSFNNESYTIQAYSDIKKEVLMLIVKEIEEDSKTINYIIEDTIEYIKKETIGGELDFSKMIIGYGGVNAGEKANFYALSMWSHAVKDLGIKDVKEIYKLWEKIHKKKLSAEEKMAILEGLKEK